jgi:hypothetical protein
LQFHGLGTAGAELEATYGGLFLVLITLGLAVLALTATVLECEHLYI